MFLYINGNHEDSFFHDCGIKHCSWEFGLEKKIKINS